MQSFLILLQRVDSSVLSPWLRIKRPLTPSKRTDFMPLKTFLVFNELPSSLRAEMRHPRAARWLSTEAWFPWPTEEQRGQGRPPRLSAPPPRAPAPRRLERRRRLALSGRGWGAVGGSGPSLLAVAPRRAPPTRFSSSSSPCNPRQHAEKTALPIRANQGVGHEPLAPRV